MEFRDRKLCTLEGVVLSSCAIQVSPLPSSTQRRILDACGFKATLLFPKDPFSFAQSSYIGHMYHFLLPDARCIFCCIKPCLSLRPGSRARLALGGSRESYATSWTQRGTCGSGKRSPDPARCGAATARRPWRARSPRA